MQEEDGPCVLTPELFCSKNRHPHSIRQHSLKVDALLGLNMLTVEGQLIKKIQRLTHRPHNPLSEQHVYPERRTWIGLDPQVLNTSYDAFFHLFKFLRPLPGQKIIDLGAGYGRLAYVLHAFYPLVHYMGFELVKERVDAGNSLYQKWQLKNAELVEEDLLRENFEIPLAHFYFIYDYGEKNHIYKTLTHIQNLPHKHPYQLIMSGKASNLLTREHPIFEKSSRDKNIDPFHLYWLGESPYAQ